VNQVPKHLGMVHGESVFGALHTSANEYVEVQKMMPMLALAQIPHSKLSPFWPYINILFFSREFCEEMMGQFIVFTIFLPDNSCRKRDHLLHFFPYFDPT
jgi:hypothetical protein